MGWLSKVAGGIKSAVKTVARTVKKVAKKVVTSMPGGDKLWSAGTKLGGKIMKGVGKIADTLGPVGMMALSFVIPALGPALSAMWGSFGAGAVAMVNSTNALVAGLGHVGTAIFNGANFVGGTLGAMGDAIGQGASELMKGNFAGTGDAFAQSMSKAFTGESGMAALNQGATKAALQAGGKAALNNVGAQKVLSDEAMNKAIKDSILSPESFAKGATESGGLNIPEMAFEKGANEGISLSGTTTDAFGNSLNQSALTPDFLKANGGKTGLESSLDTALNSTPYDLGKQSGAVLPTTPTGGTLANKVGKAAGLIGGMMGGGEGGGGMAPQDTTAGRKFHAVSAAGQTPGIRAHQGGNLYQNLLAQARGSFA